MNGTASGPTHATSPDAAPPSQPPAAAQTPAWRLLATLGFAGALAGLLIVLAYGWAQPRIEAHQAAVLRLAVQEVLRQPARYDALFVHDGRIAATLPAGVDSAGVERVYLGYDAATRRLLGMKVLESKETPGLGDRIEKDSAFVSAFRGVATPLLGVKSGAGRSEENEVDMITGATISSRTLIDAINAALARLGPLLEAYEPGGEP